MPSMVFHSLGIVGAGGAVEDVDGVGVPEQQAGVVEVEELLCGVAVDVVGEVDLERAVADPVLDERRHFFDAKSGIGEQEWRRKVGPPGLTGEVGCVQGGPRRVVGQAAIAAFGSSTDCTTSPSRTQFQAPVGEYGVGVGAGDRIERDVLGVQVQRDADVAQHIGHALETPDGTTDANLPRRRSIGSSGRFRRAR